MKTRKLGKRLLAFAMTLAIAVSMFSVLSITSFAAGYTPKLKVFLADATDANGNNDDDSLWYEIIKNEHHDSYWTGSTYQHTGDVTADAEYFTKDKTEKYTFRNWTTKVEIVVGGSAIGSSYPAETSNRTMTYNFTSVKQFTDIVYISGAIYDTNYRIQVATQAPIDEYVKYNKEFTLPMYDGDVPEGQMFVGWRDTYSSIIFAQGTTFIPDAARNFVPVFVTENKGLAYFKEADTGVLYHVEEVDPQDDTVIAPTAPTKKGYKFVCWTDGVKNYAPGETIENAEDKVLTAVWEAKKYEISIDVPENADLDFHFPELDNTFAPVGCTVKFTVDTDTGIKLTKVTVEGDETEGFIAYKYDEATQMYSFVMPTEDVTIKVGTTSEKFIAYFKDSMTNQIYDIKYVDPDTDSLITASEPTKEGYTFDYWYQIPGNEYPADTLISGVSDSDYVFYAHWSVNDYTVSTIAGGSAVINVSKTNPDFGVVVTFTVEDTAVDEVITSITVEGKDTSGFYAYKYDEASGEYYFDMPAEDVTIRVKTDIPAYLVYFKDYEGQIYDVFNFDADTDVLHTPVAPEKLGYEFEAWDNGVADYDADSDIAVPDSAHNIYYAQWTPKIYNVDDTSLVEGSAYVNVSSTTAAYNTTVTFKVGDTNPNENIVKIEVYGTDSSRYVVYNYDPATEEYSFVMPAEDVKICVETSIDEYSVLFLDYNNDYIATRTVLKGESVGDLNMPSEPYREGYTFDKWVILDEFTSEEFDGLTKVYSNLVVKAEYIGNDYNIYKASDCDEELEYLYVKSQDSTGYVYSNVDLTDNGVTNGVAKCGDKVYINVAPDPTYYITGIAIREPGTDNYVATPTLVRKYKDSDDNDCYEFAFTMPYNDVEIAVYVAPNVYDVTVYENVDEDGTFRINGIDAYSFGVAQGTTATIEIRPEPGYYVSDVTSVYIDEHGNPAYPSAYMLFGANDIVYYMFEMVSNDVEVYVEYTPYDYTINVTDSNEDSFKPVWNNDIYEVVESLDPDETSKGLVSILDDSENKIMDKVEREAFKLCMQPINVYDANVGDEIEFVVDEFIGYDLDCVVVTYEGGTKTCPVTFKDGKYHFTMPAGDVDIRAYFTEESYKVTKGDEDELTNDGVTETEMGTVTINKLRETAVYADYKDEIVVNVQPKPGFYVESINFALVDGTNIDSETVKNFNEDVKYEGTELTDTPDTAHSITFNMPACDVDISVTYAKIKYSVETEVTSGDDTGTITVNTPNYYNDQVSFKIEPKYGYVLNTFKVVNVSTGKKMYYIAEKVDGTYGDTFTMDMPASKVKITAEFVKDAYTVIYKDSNDTVLLTEAIKFEDTATLGTTPVSAPSGKHFVGWTSADTKTPVTTPSLDKSKFVINKDTVIVANYVTDATNVVYKKTTNGYVTNTDVAAQLTKSADQKKAYKYGDTITFKAVPDEGYTVYEVKVTCKAPDGVATNYVPVIEGVDNYSFVIPAVHKTDVKTATTDDVTLEVIFCKDEFTLEKKDDFENGTVAINGKVDTDTAYTYDYKSLVTITATPDKGYYVKSIVATMDAPVNTTEDAGSGYSYTYYGVVPEVGTDGTAQTIKFPMPATDMKYSVVFEKCTYNIETAQTGTLPGDHGTVTVSPASTAQVGDIITITADPDDGFKFYDISVLDAFGNPIITMYDSMDEFYVAKYTFTMPAENVNVTVQFEQEACREYIDVRSDNWYYDAVNFVSARGFFQGYGANTELFGACDNIMRQDFVIVLAKMAGADLTPYIGVASKYTDVDKDAYYAAAIAWATDNGIVYGYADGTGRFGVGDFILRQDIVAILYRYSKFMGYTTALDDEALAQKNHRYSFYGDLNLLSDYAAESMAWGIGYGVLNGKSATTLCPTLTATRAEVAQMIKNLYDHNIAR